VNQLVALDLPAGPEFVDHVKRIWDAGDAFTPMDPRLPKAERAAVFAALRPTAIVGADGLRSSLERGRPVEPGDAFVIATSGTTGFPKGVVHTHQSMRASAVATSAAINIDPAVDHWLACLPLAHIGGLSVVLRALCTETALTVHDGFDALAVTQAAREFGVTRVSLVTKALRQIDPAMFTTVLLGGAAPPADRPANCIATYGMTETGSGVVYERKPLDGVSLKIDEDGQIHIAGPMLLRAYRMYADDIDPKSSDGWFPTGDIGGFNADESLYVSGRVGDVIVTGGEKVWPSRVEPLLAQHPLVAEVVIAGRLDNEWGHVVVAHVVPSDPLNPPSLEALREVVKAKLPTWYAPKVLVVHSWFPKTALGKVRRAELRD
jgi:o-succinylbenzoate---CoA ligase